MKQSIGSKVGEYTLISKCMDTISEQTVIDYYDNDMQLRTTVVEKETRGTKGNYVRLVGSTLRHKEGYPPLVFDTGVRKTDTKFVTGFSAFLPTVTAEEHSATFDLFVQEQLNKKGIHFYLLKDTANIPEYLKKIPDYLRKCGFSLQREGKNLELIEELKDISFAAYEEVLQCNPSPCQAEKFTDYLINEQAKNEHEIFKKLGLCVPSKVQKAFFTLFSERTEFTTAYNDD
jgi:hypothetical protein